MGAAGREVNRGMEEVVGEGEIVTVLQPAEGKEPR
jgi:hypothetical protein